MKVKRYKKDDDITYSLGVTVTMEFLLGRPSDVKAVLLHPSFDSKETLDKILKLCRENNIPTEIDAKAFNILSQKENCFVAGVIAKQPQTLRPGNHIVLVNPSNDGNMGTIMRSALGFGFKDIAVITPAADPDDPKTIRASMGARAKVRVQMFGDFKDYRAVFPGNSLYPFMLDGSVMLGNVDIREPFSLIFGNEATGLPAWFSTVGTPVRIDHGHDIDSLNLPIAASIAMYESTKGKFGGNAG